jgi:two-component system, chemotaxis family, protein-glutamate methylesterase/glutaminase
MTAKIIRVLVVDDSMVMRAVLRELIQSAPDMKVVGTAADGQEALGQIEAFRPDVVTLDVEMPTMDGLAALEAILARQPVPAIMVSAVTKLGAKTTLDALDRGAVDCVLKPDPGADATDSFREELLRKIRSSAGIDVHRILAIRRERKVRRSQLPRPAAAKPLLETGAEDLAGMCVAVGISTGGPSALTLLFEALRPPMPAIVGVQHMPRRFTGPLACRLDGLSALSIKEAEADDVLRPNHVLIAPAGRHLLLRRSGDSVRVRLEDGPPQSGHRPSVDVMMQSAAKLFGANCLGVIMTGMGRDGVDGCAAIRAAGGYVLGQDEATSDVYGMNKIAYLSGHVDRQFSLDDAARSVSMEVTRLLSLNKAAS